MTTCAIYAIKNTVNNKVYIGSSKKASLRINTHRHLLNKNAHNNFHLQSSWNKHGAGSFEFIILQRIELEADLLKYEQSWMDWFKCYDYNLGFNINRIAGSNTGYLHTDEHKAKISERHRNRTITEETRERMRKAKSIFKNLDKWPHERGCRCKCRECKDKILKYNRVWKKNKRDTTRARFLNAEAPKTEIGNQEI